MVSSSGIYMLINVVNGKRYVGQSKDLSRRKREHIRLLKRGGHYNTHLQSSFDKYGQEYFDFIILEHCGVKELNERESYWIREFDVCDKEKGYNSMSVGSAVVHSDETRLKISRTRKERLRLGIIKPTVVDFTPEARERMSKSISLYFSVESNRREISITRTSFDIETIISIKTMLKENLGVTSKEVADKFGVSVNSVNHIIALASNSLILEEYNYVIKNRNAIFFKRTNKKIMSMYREGYSYSEIGRTIGIHHRNVIKRINNICNEHDKRCRLNACNRAARKKRRMVKTYINAGYTYSQISKIFNINRGNITGIVKGTSCKEFASINDTRGKARPLEYRREKRRSPALD